MSRNVAHDRQQILLVAGLQQVFQLEADVEVVFDGGLAAAGHDDDVLNAGMDRLFDAVLDDRLIDDRQHLFRLRLGGGQKAGAEPGGGKNGFANFGRASATSLRARMRHWQPTNCVSPPAVLCIGTWEKTAMAYVIAEPCIGTKDTACVDACPVDCIHPKKDEPGYADAELLYIDPVECIDCGACVPVCPVSAIFALDDLPEKWNEFTAKNAAYYGK